METTGSSVAAFIVTDSMGAPDVDAVLRRASELDLPLEVEPGDDPARVGFRLEGGELVGVVAMDSPIPDLDDHPSGPTSPPPELLRAARSHLLVHSTDMLALQERAGALAARTLMSVVTAAIMAGTEAVAALVGSGRVYHRADVFDALAASAASTAELPALLLVDVTSAAEPDDRISFLTHGMELVGRDEEIYLTCRLGDRDGFDWFCALIEHLVDEPSTVLPTGDTIGRDADEQVVIQHQLNPSVAGAPVMRLDLP